MFEDKINNGSIRKQLEEIRNLEISIGTNTILVIDTYSETLGKTKVDELKSDITTLQNLVLEHEKNIENKIKEVVPQKIISSYEQEMLNIQRQLVQIELEKKEASKKKIENETKKGKAEVVAKVGEFRNLVRKIEGDIKLIETRADPEYWKTVESPVVRW